jgi:hypothetical protein
MLRRADCPLILSRPYINTLPVKGSGILGVLLDLALDKFVVRVNAVGHSALEAGAVPEQCCPPVGIGGGYYLFNAQADEAKEQSRFQTCYYRL